MNTLHPVQILPSPRLRTNEWCRRNCALAQHRTEGLESIDPDIFSSNAEVSPQMDIPSTSGRSIDASGQILSTNKQPMLQLVAAWDSLASRLPPQTGAGPDADLLVNTLKLVLSQASQSAASRALALASRLAEVAGDGVPLDAGAIAAGILAEAFPQGFPGSIDELEERFGHAVVALLADLNKVRRLPARIELYDDAAAAALRELCLAFYDVRATAVEIVSRLHSLEQGAEAARGGAADADLQVSALEVLQIYAPLGHALGMSTIAQQLEDLCFQVLFPASYEATNLWLHQQAEENAAALEEAKKTLLIAVESLPRFKELAQGLDIYGRTKSPFSTLKKLLRLGDTSKGGRSRNEVYDLIGLRAVVVPRNDLSAAEADILATEACYLVEQTAHSLWRPIEGRSKDYIRAPKPNGYQSLHSAVALKEEMESGQMRTLELQIRTQDMHTQAESGAAAHAAYKGGLDAHQARQLREWTEALLKNTVPTAAALPAASDSEEEELWALPAEALFRSLDLNGDGRVSLEELRHVVAELGGNSELDAEALLAAADSNSDGEVSLSEFLDFQNRVGIVHAASAMDEATAAAAEKLLCQSHGSSSPRNNNAPFSAASSAQSTPPMRNSTSSTALQSWNSRGTGSSDSGDSPRNSKNRRPAQASASFVEGQEGAAAAEVDMGMSSQNGWSIDYTMDDSTDPNGLYGDTPSVSNSSTARDQVVQESTSSPEAVVADVGGVDASSSSASSPSVAVTTLQRPQLVPNLREKPERKQSASKMERAMRGFMRMFQRAGVAELSASWELMPLPIFSDAESLLCDAAGQSLRAAPGSSPLFLPRHGPCIVGAVRDRDCDIVLDLPTVSGRHARFEVIRQRNVGLSKCVIMDLGSTNGTWVNRARITPFKEVPLYPGDVVCLAEPNIAFEVQVSGESDAAAAAEAARRRNGETGEAWGPAVTAALRAAAALEAEAASRGVFAPVEALGSIDIGAKARDMLTAGDYQAAYMLLLGSVMATPDNASLWAQLAAMERQRARRKEQCSSAATSRIFLRAAVERFEAMPDPADRRAGLARVFSTWAQLEYDMRNDGPARILFQKAVRAAQSHPAGPAATGAAKLLFTWASREWKLGDAPLASRLCKEALEVDPKNAYALTLLGNINASSGDVSAARDLFRQAISADSKYVTALQSWARMEAQSGNIKAARSLFKRALKVQPTNTFVLQAWGVAEGRAGRVQEARVLFERCVGIDPKCRAAWHAWGKLEEEAGDVEKARELYSTVLRLKKDSVETLSALGRLERTAGNISVAKAHLNAALKADPRHAPSLQEFAQVLRTEGSSGEAYRLEKKAKMINQDRKSMLAQVNKRPAMPFVDVPAGVAPPPSTLK